MQITRVFKQADDGDYTFELRLSDEQVAFLVNFAVGQLVTAGLATYEDLDEDGNSVEPEVAEETTPEKNKLN